MTPIFPYANILTGLSILLVGFLFHWIGQLISVLNWELAVRLGLQEKNMPPAYKVYEHVSGGLKMYPNRRFENAAEGMWSKAAISINFGGQ